MVILKNIAKLLWGAPYDGSINRVGYIQGLALMTFVFIVFILFIVLSIVIIEAIMGGNAHQSQLFLYETMGIPFMALSAIMFFGLFFANVNLAAKRLRNMGLQGWLTIILFFTVDVSLIYIYGKRQSAFFEIFTLVFLVFMPPNIFKFQKPKA